MPIDNGDGTFDFTPAPGDTSTQDYTGTPQSTPIPDASTNQDFSPAGDYQPPSVSGDSPVAQEFNRLLAQGYQDLSGVSSTLAGGTPPPQDSLVKRLMAAWDGASNDTKTKALTLGGSAILSGLSEMITGKNKKTMAMLQQNADANTSNAATNSAHVKNLETAAANARTSMAATGYTGPSPTGLVFHALKNRIPPAA